MLKKWISERVMGRTRLFVFLMLGFAASTGAGEKPANVTEMIVPNVRDRSPACKVQIRTAGERCADGICELPVAPKSSKEPVKVTFSCIQTSDQTGFENPAPEMKYFFVHYRSGTGHMGVLDADSIPGEPATQEILFCLSGQRNRLCGFARFPKPKNKQAPEVSQLRSLIERTDFTATALVDEPTE